MNPWEASALEYRFTGEDEGKRSQATRPADRTGTTDSLFYPGMYCPSGLDVLSVLLRIFARPNPTVDLGPIDGSVAMVVCDLAQQDNPIVYASDAFQELTGYGIDEIRGRNCRLLQAPGGGHGVRPARSRCGAAGGAGAGAGADEKPVIRSMRDAIQANREYQARITNFKKTGEAFTNILSIIPIKWDGDDFRYSVGFLCQL
ncbi:hypothetical protein VPNG_04462 [Cytospora leucostoma]|uniref:PAS domain-containing protein n=1 Tax=Cytospora leucostoma TaxID=1230097 RepID=A0A423XC30_9PEZI|nr:hypothetical protein VPNG_04462 [Cytospora leucostoma]